MNATTPKDVNNMHYISQWGFLSFFFFFFFVILVRAGVLMKCQFSLAVRPSFYEQFFFDEYYLSQKFWQRVCVHTKQKLFILLSSLTFVTDI